MIKLERINGENTVAGFPDIYNKNNGDIENEFGNIQKKLIEVVKKLKSKVDRSEIESTIERIVKEALGDNEYLTRDEVESLLNQYFKDYDLSGVIETLESLTKRIDELEESFGKRISKIEEQLKNIGAVIPSDVEIRLSALEDNQYYPEIVEINGHQTYVMKKHKK